MRFIKGILRQGIILIATHTIKQLTKFLQSRCLQTNAITFVNVSSADAAAGGRRNNSSKNKRKQLNQAVPISSDATQSRTTGRKRRCADSTSDILTATVSGVGPSSSIPTDVVASVSHPAIMPTTLEASPGAIARTYGSVVRTCTASTRSFSRQAATDVWFFMRGLTVETRPDPLPDFSIEKDDPKRPPPTKYTFLGCKLCTKLR